MSKKKTHEEFVEEMNIINPNIRIIGKYRTTNEKIDCECKIHNYSWSQYPYHLLAGRGCMLCGRERTTMSRKITTDMFVEKLSDVNPNLEYLDGFSNSNNQVHIQCKICNYDWFPIAGSLIFAKHFGCPKCAGNAVKTTEEFENELSDYAPFFKLLSPYERATKKVHVQCKDCGHDDWITPNKLKSGQGCKYCKESGGEKRIRYFLEKNHIRHDSQKTFDGLIGLGGGLLSYDFYLEDYNCLLEFQGIQHEKPTKFKKESVEITNKKFEKQQKHDNLKREYAKLHNIELLEIWYYDYDNIEQILRDKLDALQIRNAS